MAGKRQFENDAEEYAFILNNPLLFEAVIKEFGYKPVSKYGSYAQVNPWMRSKILRWVHSQEFNWDDVFGPSQEDSTHKEGEDHVGQSQEVVQQLTGVAQQDVVSDAMGNVLLKPNNPLEEEIGNQIDLMDRLNLEKRISDLEIIFQQLKKLKERRQRDESTEESSGSNHLG